VELHADQDVRGRVIDDTLRRVLSPPTSNNPWRFRTGYRSNSIGVLRIPVCECAARKVLIITGNTFRKNPDEVYSGATVSCVSHILNVSHNYLNQAKSARHRDPRPAAPLLYTKFLSALTTLEGIPLRLWRQWVKFSPRLPLREQERALITCRLGKFFLECMYNCKVARSVLISNAFFPVRGLSASIKRELFLGKVA